MWSKALDQINEKTSLNGARRHWLEQHGALIDFFAMPTTLNDARLKACSDYSNSVVSRD